MNMKIQTLEKEINSNLRKIKVSELMNYSDREILIPSPDGMVAIGDFYLKTRKTVSVRLDTGIEEKVSVDHKYLTNEGWVDAENCKGKSVLTTEGFVLVTDVIEGEVSKVYDFEVLHPEHRYYTANGLVSHNTGKTFVILNIAREMQKAGYFVIYGDSEAAVDEDLFRKFGLDTTKVRYQPLKTVLQTRHIVTNLCATIKEKIKAGYEVPKVCFVIDSIGNLATEKETADAMSGSDKRDMTKQQNLKSLFRVITTELAELKIPLVLANHTYQNVGGYIPMQIQSGGTGLVYATSVILEFSKAGLKDAAEDQAEGLNKSGIVVTSKMTKGRFARPIPIKFHISFYKGMNPYVGLENYVSWDVCGIGRGKLIEEIIEHPIYEEDGVTQKILRGKPAVRKENTGNWIYLEDQKANTFAVKHLGKVVKGANLFTKEVFTDEIIDILDEKVIKKTFELPDVGDFDEDEELDEVIGEDDEDDFLDE